MKYILPIFIAFMVSGCATPKMPKMDFLKLREFQEDYENIKDYPKVTEAPAEPTGLRSAKAWDDAAKSIIKERDGFAVPVGVEDTETDAEIDQRIQALKAKAEAYKLDDPQ